MKAEGPPDALRAIPEAAASLLREVLKQADAQQLGVYLVGGPVRDLLLGRELRDVDLVVEGRDGSGAADLAGRVATGDIRVTAHDRFGTVSLQRGDVTLDLATVRRERYSHDGALPTVETGTLEEDLRRRDFAVNALALPLSRAARAHHAGVVGVDEGVADLDRRQLRVLHPRSFHDDPTRALRAARLAPRLGFTLSRGSRSALRDALRDGAFGRVSGDRLRREIVKLFDDSALGLDPARALRLLADWHVLGALEPGLTLEREVVVPLRRLGRAVEAPAWRRGRWRPWVAGLELWLAPAPPGLRRRVLRRFSVRGETAKRIDAFAKARDGWLRGLERARGRGAIDGLLRQLDEEELHALYASVAPSMRRRIVRYAAEDRSRRAPIGGDDLVAIGLEGPAVGRALARIRAAYLDGAVSDRSEALALARELSRRKGPARAGSRSGKAPPARS
jgi:tRNA nucleotidyltransferase (CCA-adding enzyme)